MIHKVRFPFIAILVVAMTVGANAQTSVQTGNWNVTTTWVGGVVPAQTTDVIIASGHTVTVTNVTNRCKNLTVNDGGILTADGNILASTNKRQIRFYGTTVINNGTMGTGADGLSLDIYNTGETTLSGTHTLNIATIRPGQAMSGTLTIAGNVSLSYSTGLQFQNSTGQNFTTVNVNSGCSLSTIGGADIKTASSVSTNISDFAPVFNVSGTVLVDGSLTLRSSFGAPSIVVTSPGTLTINNNVRLTTTTYTNPGVVSGNGSFTLGPAGNLELAIADGMNSTTGQIRTTTRSFPTTASYTYVGTSAQVTGGELPLTVGRLTVNNSNGVTLTNNLAVDTILALQKGALVAGGNSITYGTAGTLAYTDSTAQTSTDVEFPSSNGPKSLTVNKSAYFYTNIGNLTLHASRTLADSLILTRSKLVLGSNDLTVRGIRGGADTVYVDVSGSGKLIKSVSAAGSYTLPVGDATNYSPATINVTAGSFSSASFGINVSGSKHGSNTSVTDYINRYWTVTNTGITGLAYDPTFTYKTSDVAGTEANLYGGAYNGSSWSLLAAVNTGTHSFAGTGLSAASLVFTAGEQTALPVEMTSFTASMQNASSAILQWSTATEVNNNGFEIERRAEKSSGWTKLGFVCGAGTSTSPKNYTYQDANLAPGVYNYRLKQIDNAGTFKYSGITQVNAGVSRVFELQGNYPNPFNPETNIRFSVPEDGFATLKVVSMLGQEVATLFNGQAQSGHYIQVTFNAGKLASGVYFSRLDYNGKSIVKRMLMTK